MIEQGADEAGAVDGRDPGGTDAPGDARCADVAIAQGAEYGFEGAGIGAGGVERGGECAGAGAVAVRGLDAGVVEWR